MQNVNPNPITEVLQPKTGVVVKSRFWRRILLFFMVWGPGLIVMEADNDAGAISTYTQAGGQYGLKLMWVLLLLLPITYICQEMVVRLGVVTGKGHASMIYERFGKWWGRFSLFDLELVNFMTLITEFAAVALVSQQIGLSPYVAVPLAALLLILMVGTGSYLNWERMAIVLSLGDAIWVLFAIAARAPAGELLRSTFIPSVPASGITGSLIFLVIAIVGTTIAPWQLFFQQSCIADKRLRYSNLFAAQLDTFTGAVFTIVVAGAMMILGYVLFRNQIPYQDPAQMAAALNMGDIVKYGVMLLWVDAALLGATAVSLASSWAWSEVTGWKNSLQDKIVQAPGFYAIYIGAVVLAGAFVLIPRAPLQLIIIGVQVLAGIILPVALVFLQILLNDKQVMGRYVNKPWQNVINWIIIGVLFVMSAALMLQSLFPNLFPA